VGDANTPETTASGAFLRASMCSKFCMTSPFGILIATPRFKGPASRPAEGKPGSRTTMINAQEIQGQWNKIRGHVKERWGQLTDDDLAIHGGNVDQLVGRIQQKTGEGRESIETFLNDLSSRGSAGIAHAAETARGYMQSASSYVQDAMEGAGGRLREGYGQIAENARERFEMAEDMVRHNPAESVAAAFGVGLVVGLIVGIALRSR
jgi:uncharacterized protein YjbJ (UPF0337 family)